MKSQQLSRKESLERMLAGAGIFYATLTGSSCSKIQPSNLEHERLNSPIEVTPNTLKHTIEQYSETNPYVVIHVRDQTSDNFFRELAKEYDPRDVLLLECDPECAKEMSKELGYSRGVKELDVSKTSQFIAFESSDKMLSGKGPNTFFYKGFTKDITQGRIEDNATYQNKKERFSSNLKR